VNRLNAMKRRAGEIREEFQRRRTDEYARARRLFFSQAEASRMVGISRSTAAKLDTHFGFVNKRWPKPRIGERARTVEGTRGGPTARELKGVPEQPYWHCCVD